MKAVLKISAFSLLLSGCGNNPTTVSEISPVEPMATVRSQNYGAIDTFSFSQATVKYPASEGTHTVPVGTYFLSKIIDRIPPKASKVRLTKFDGSCERTGFVLPHVVCSLTAEVSIAGVKPKIVTFAAKQDVGNLKVKSEYTISGQVDYGDATIKQQVQMAVDALAASGSF